MEKHERLGYQGLYLERGGVDAELLTAELLRSPEYSLSEEERQEAYMFEGDLFSHQVREGASIGEVIRSQKGEEVIAPFFFAQPFVEGSVTAPESFKGLMPPFESGDEVYRWFGLCAKEGNVSAKELRDIAKRSGEVYRDKVATSLLSDESLDPKWYEVQSIVVAPEMLIDATRDIAAARKYLIELTKEYKEETPLEGAKRAFIEVYLARVNSAVATAIPMIATLKHQAESVGDEDMTTAASLAIPWGFRGSIDDRVRQQEVFRRLDFLRNGMGLDENGRASAVSLALEKTSGSAEDTSEARPRFTSDEMKIIKETMVNPSEVKTMMEALLSSANLLSDEPSETWNLERMTRAGDELFQVVEHSIPSFAVNGKSGVYKIPSQPCSLYKIMVVGGVHEPTHISQAQADKRLGESIKIASLGGKRLAMLREGGADVQERAAGMRLFGESKPVALTYARALQSLEEDGDICKANRAFYEEKRRVMPSMNPWAVAQEAADRVLRLVRQGGISSTAMSYAEGGLFVAELSRASPEAKRRAGAITSLDLVDQLRLHRYGLLPADDTVDDIDWAGLSEVVFEPYVREALEKGIR
jgi:hypothetical protein